MRVVPSDNSIILLENGDLLNSDQRASIEKELTEKTGLRCVFMPESFSNSSVSEWTQWTGEYHPYKLRLGITEALVWGKYAFAFAVVSFILSAIALWLR